MGHVLARPLKLIRCRVVRPIYLFGRICATREILRLDSRDADPLIASGHIEEIGDAVLIARADDRCTTPTVR